MCAMQARLQNIRTKIEPGSSSTLYKSRFLSNTYQQSNTLSIRVLFWGRKLVLIVRANIIFRTKRQERPSFTLLLQFYRFQATTIEIKSCLFLNLLSYPKVVLSRCTWFQIYCDALEVYLLELIIKYRPRTIKAYIKHSWSRLISFDGMLGSQNS
jgi:hypothetical protein